VTKDIARLADWANYISAKGSGTGLSHGLDLMIRLIQSRPDQIIHSSIHNREMLPPRLFSIENFRYQNTGVSNKKTTWFQQNFHLEITQHWHERGRVISQSHRSLGARRPPPTIPTTRESILIDNPHSATDIEVL
jgi:hypothetical protein